MFGKKGTRYLLIAIAVLALAWFLSEKFSTRAQQRTFRSEVIRVDTAAVTRITARSPKTGPDGLTVERHGSEWMALSNGREYRVDAASIRKVLNEFAVVKADHVLGNMDQQRKPYDLTDSLATRMDFTAGSSTTSILVGKEAYNQQGEPLTAVNVPGEEEVYGLNKLLMSLREFNLDGLRPHTLVNGDPETWQRVTFTFPQDTGYVFEREGSLWLVDSLPTDSEKVIRFFKSLAFSRAQNFADTVSIVGLTPSFQLKVEDSAKPEPLVVNVFPYGYTWVVTSTANPGNVMYFDPVRELPRMFRPRRVWLKDTAAPASP